jgi:hypothetical protein
MTKKSAARRVSQPADATQPAPVLSKVTNICLIRIAGYYRTGV